ncbi:unnamed protein product [Eruca vesicaria subsp. sativa]|uniref:Uncharacterized protein n=1 Tax=Eruca vesicaria subsp. sativa TaxID=29727 RepID=A0ABC8KV99_ERUVS|nr:unnamed protein product [Eruca vesicaria subsp. sativa]
MTSIYSTMKESIIRLGNSVYRLPKDDTVLQIVQPKTHGMVVTRDDKDGSLMLTDSSSPPVEAADITPAKRRGESVNNLEDAYAQKSVTKLVYSRRIKQEKDSKRG